MNAMTARLKNKKVGPVIPNGPWAIRDNHPYQKGEKMKRRSFLKATLATTAFGTAPFNILPAGPSPNSKLN